MHLFSANLAARRVAEHVDAEHGNRVDEIMATVSRHDVHYAILAPAGAGLDLMLAGGRDAARAYYERDRTRWNHVRSDHRVELNGPWYSFHESVGSLAPVDGGEPLRPHSAVLFPVWEDGIMGEIVWLREPGQSCGTALDVAAAFGALARRLREDAVVVERTLALDSERRELVVARGRAEINRLGASRPRARILEEERLAFVAESWYAFAVLRQLVETAGGHRLREIAELWALDAAGRVAGRLSYAIVTASSSSSS